MQGVTPANHMRHENSCVTSQLRFDRKEHGGFLHSKNRKSRQLSGYNVIKGFDEMNPDWFKTRQVGTNIFCSTEHHFALGNRANCWLIKGAAQNVIIDAGLGVCDLKEHLTKKGLLEADRPVVVVVTHNHFDHSGGAHHFDQVLVHHEDRPGLLTGSQMECLNYVQSSNFAQQPYPGFSACRYAVPPTKCSSVVDGDVIELGGGDHLKILHVPGHTKGSIAIHYPRQQILFTGDTVYECGFGGNFLDWLPTSDVTKYVQSAQRLIDWLQDHHIKHVFPGHFESLTAWRTESLLEGYIEAREGCACRGCVRGVGCCLAGVFGLGCYRCCAPC